LAPWNQAQVFASRDVEFVVIDPAAKLPPLVDQWLSVLSVDPANPSWWQRLPTWAQVSRLRGRPPGAVGNVRPVVRPGATGDLVELPPAPAEGDPYWQAYTLPVKEPGKPHLVEVEYPAGREQHLSISVIEPDAAGRVMSPSVDAGVFTAADSAAEGSTAVSRIVFWPRTRSPQLLLVNQHPSQPAQFGKLTLLQQDAAAAAPEATDQPSDERLVAGYLAAPDFAANFGAAEVRDEPSGLSIQGWSTFLEGAQRLAQYLKFSRYNGALLTVAADGSAIYPSRVLSPSPRYDTGIMASRAQDPTRKDVLEMLLRIFDREGLRLVPTLQLATPLPRLEELRVGQDSCTSGFAPVDHTGQTWLKRNAPSAGLAPYYNPLNETVQAEVSRLVEELTHRYGSHQSLAGVGLQLSSEGYGMLPGIAWGLDDDTMQKFTEDTHVELPAGDGAERFYRRAEELVRTHRRQWQNWRSDKLAEFYSRLGENLTRERDDLQLVLTTENLFAGPLLQRRLREAVSGGVQLDQALRDHGLDLAKLDQQPQITVLGSYRLDSDSQVWRQALDLRQNAATEQGEYLPLNKERGVLVYHLPKSRRLASFDQLSPYGSGRTHLSLASQSLLSGATARRTLVTALAREDARVVVDGGLRLPLGQHAQVRDLLETIQQLPDVNSQVRAQAKQPLVMRVYRSEDSTTVLVLNESPWPLGVRLSLDSVGDCAWRSLGEFAGASSDQPVSRSGTLPGGAQLWEVELAPYDLKAWTFATGKLRIAEPLISLDELARSQLQRRIEEIESRTGNLNIQRPYLQLQNPGFEMQEAGERIFGWQTPGGAPGAVSLVSDEAHAGDRALRIKNEGAAGVAVESHLFPMPKTGQLVVGAFVKGRNVGPDAQLHIVLEDGQNGRGYLQYATLNAAQLAASDWTRYEFPVDDIPFEGGGQLRIRFQLFGRGEVLIDDVELYDLRFDSARRGALVKRVYAAKTALEENQFVDCQRLVDGYWSRYLVEFVPPVETGGASLAKQPPAPNPPDEAEEAKRELSESRGFGGRLRNWMPRLWR
jgi:hypothetical protein